MKNVPPVASTFVLSIMDSTTVEATGGVQLLHFPDIKAPLHSEKNWDLRSLSYSSIPHSCPGIKHVKGN